MSESYVTVVGAGLAGSEAAYQLARRGIAVRLVEMRPVKMTEAHRTADFAELVCSNSLRNDSMETAVGVLKEEMRRLGSIVIAAADRTRVPAGSALAVDRNDFSRAITAALEDNPMVEISRVAALALAAPRGSSDGGVFPRRGFGHPRRSDHSRHRSSDQPGAGRVAQPPDRCAQLIFLRRDRANRRRRFDRHGRGVQGLALRQGWR